MAKGKRIETQQNQKTATGLIRRGSSNTRGYFRFEENINANGNTYINSDRGEYTTKNGNSANAVNGDNVHDIKGSNSTVVSGLSEKVTASNYHITGTAYGIKMALQEAMDEAQNKIVAARSQPDEVPDMSLLAPLTDLFKLAPGLSKCIKQPAAEKAKKIMAETKLPDENSPLDGTLLGGIFKDLIPGTALNGILHDVACETIKVGALLSSITADSLSEMAKIQANYMKDTAKKNFEEKKKMFEKMRGASATAFKENMGKMLFPDGKFSLDGVADAATAISNPSTLMAMFIPPSTEDAKKKKNFDIQEYQKIAAEEQTKPGGILDMERASS